MYVFQIFVKHINAREIFSFHDVFMDVYISFMELMMN